MKKLYSFLLLTFLSTGIYAQTVWEVDKAHSQVSFSIDHLGISEIQGWFREFDAIIRNEGEEDWSNAEFEVEIDVNSVDTGVSKRDDHLRTADFFDAENYPKMTFTSNSVEKISEDRYRITGDLSLHGVTKEVTLDAHFRGTAQNPQNNQTIAGFQVTGSINRSDFKIGEKFGQPMLGDEVRIRVDGEFKKQS